MCGATDIPVGLEVDAYFDLHRRVLSLRAIRGDLRGRVIAKPAGVVLRGVRFRVNRGGLVRARAEGRRNVHAYARGTVVSGDVAGLRGDPRAQRIRYNPFEYSSFVAVASGNPVSEAEIVAIDAQGAWAVLSDAA